MIALHFGQPEAPLFGVYHPAATSRAGAHAIVVCNAFGTEYMVSHLALRRMAIALAARGHDVLRFDYFGTGDSTGEQEDISLSQWTSDIGAAVDELSDMSGRTPVTLLGVRLGAGLACQFAASQPDRIRAVVAWDPIFVGDTYLAWLQQLERIRRPAGSAEPQVVGHPLPDTFREQLRLFNVEAPARGLGSRLVHVARAAADGPTDEQRLFTKALKTGDLIVDPDIVAAVVACFPEER
jgi:uncharacterized protein